MELNSLPLEIHLEIFSHLPVRDVMSIRLVCKLWNGLINGEFKFKQLRCYQLLKNEINNFKSYDFNFPSDRRFLDYASTDAKFSRVRLLQADLVPKTCELQDAFDFLNSFKSLNEAWFQCYVFDHRNVLEAVQKQFVVSLPRLEKADFRFNYGVGESKVPVLLDLPSLLCLSTDSFETITVGHPQKLRTLATRSLFRTNLDYSLFTSLTNIFTRVSDAPSISASFLEKLPSLSELHLDAGGYWPVDYRVPEPSLGKARLKIYYFGFEVSVREIELESAQWPNSFRIHDSTDDSARFIARNLHRSVDNNAHVHSTDYNLIAGELDDTAMFGVMHQKFSKIYHLRISGTVADQKRLLKLIDKFRITSVAFERTELPQRFFEQLIKNRPFITSLSVAEPTMSIVSGDFDFIFKCQSLTSLRFSDFPLSLSFVARALKELKSLYSLSIEQTLHCYFSLFPQSTSENFVTIYVDIYAPRSSYLDYQVAAEEAPQWMNALQRQLNVDGAVCARELQTLIRHLKYEKENALFWMRKYIYDHRHSICLSEEQMRLLNLNFRY